MGAPLGPAPSNRATLFLVGVTVLWGLSFPWTKDWQDAGVDCPGGPALAGLTLIGLRMTLALLLTAAFRPSLVFKTTPAEHKGGLLIGAVFVGGFALQTWGAAYTTPALSAFFTSLCSAWVPLLAWILFRQPSGAWTLLGLALGLSGTMVLANGPLTMKFGELLTLAASLIFAVQMLLLDRVGRRLRPGRLTVGFFTATALLAWTSALLLAATSSGVTNWLDWLTQMLSRPAVLKTLFLLVVLPTTVAFHWMNRYQPDVGPQRAALVYLLEPVFGSAFSVWVGHDQFTTPLLIGGSLILFGNLLVEAPAWLPRKPKSVDPGLS